MKRVISLLLYLSLICGRDLIAESLQKNIFSTKLSYIQNLEKRNNISYDEILNTRGIYVTSMCYTNTEDKTSKIISNPCYSCHTRGIIPNYNNDMNLQQKYSFVPTMLTNPFSNLFKDRKKLVSNISDTAILEYIRKSNYFDANGKILLQEELPQDWQGYKPDCYYNFDKSGFDRDQNGNYTLWRAFRYYPFLGTFWPTNGSTDDVLIRLDAVFAKDNGASFNIETYELNLAIVESLVKQKDINLQNSVDEVKYGVDLNQNGVLDISSHIAISTYDKMSYVGMAKQYLKENKVHLALGLFPENTEFLHSVRYVDWDNKNNHISMSKHMKELRYAKKYGWKTYSELQRIASKEIMEDFTKGKGQSSMATFRGNYEDGLRNNTGWSFQGFIEDKDGRLRPQTHEETISCMGCHSTLGSSTDSIFAFPRKFEGTDKNATDLGWNHWSQKGFVGVAELKVNYKDYGMKYEYSFYLKNNHTGNEFRDNNEVRNKFFDINGSVKASMFTKLHKDISILLFPSKARALELNKAYKTIVMEQSYIHGRDTSIKPIVNAYQKITQDQTTKISRVIVKD